jgi:hypothetical protein
VLLTGSARSRKCDDGVNSRPGHRTAGAE